MNRIERRRQYEIDLTELENKIFELHATVHNGLSTRSVETQKIVNELVKQHAEFEKDFAVHCQQDTDLHAGLDRRLALMQIGIGGIQAEQTKWNRAFFGLLFIGLAGLSGLVYWLLVHVSEIATFMEHITAAGV